MSHVVKGMRKGHKLWCVVLLLLPATALCTCSPETLETPQLFGIPLGLLGIPLSTLNSLNRLGKFLGTLNSLNRLGKFLGILGMVPLLAPWLQIELAFMAPGVGVLEQQSAKLRLRNLWRRKTAILV